MSLRAKRTKLAGLGSDDESRPVQLQLVSSPSTLKSGVKLERLFRNRTSTVETIRKIAETRNTKLKFSPCEENEIRKRQGSLLSAFAEDDIERVFRILAVAALHSRIPSINLPILQMMVEFGEVNSELLKKINVFLRPLGLTTILNRKSRHGFDVLPFSRSLNLGQVDLYVLADPNYLKNHFGSGGLTKGTEIYLPTDSQTAARHELQHTLDWLVRLWSTRVQSPSAHAVLRNELEYRAKLAEILYAADPFSAVLNFRISSRVKSKVEFLADIHSQEAHRNAEKRIVTEFDGVRKTDMRQRASVLLDTNYEKWVGLSLTEIFDFCLQR